MPNEQFTLLEATPQTIANLNRLKSISPHLNLGATEMSNGNNSSIVANPPSAGNAVITGQFDVRMIYLEEDDGQGGTEIVPYVQVYDSDNPTNGYAGYAYVGQRSYHVLTPALAPMAGYVYLYIDCVSNIAEIRIAPYIPDIQGTVRKYNYPLAQITGNGTTTPWTVTRLRIPGIIHIPEDPRGAFDVDVKYVEETENENEPPVIKPYIIVYNSSGHYSFENAYAGYVYSGSSSWQLPPTILNPMTGVVYVDINYELNTQIIAIAPSLPSLTTTDRRWVYALANVTYDAQIKSCIVQRSNQPGNLSVIGRWMD